MALAERVHSLALEVYAKRPAGVAPTAWLTDSTGVPAHRVAAQLVKQAAVLEGLTAHVGLDFALGDLLARLRETRELVAGARVLARPQHVSVPQHVDDLGRPCSLSPRLGRERYRSGARLRLERPRNSSAKI
jgi:hypothetical protein